MPGCMEQRLLRVVRIFDCVTGRDGRRTFVSAMKYHAEYASYDQGQLKDHTEGEPLNHGALVAVLLGWDRH